MNPESAPLARLRLLPWLLWTLLGTVGTVTMVSLTSPVGALPVPATSWWWRGFTHVTYFQAHVALYGGLALWSAAWLGLGVLARHGELPARRVAVTCLAWATPLFLGAPLFSRDLFSYVAEGAITRLGRNPYHVAPAAVLHGPALQSVATVWQHTTSPYGPLFVLLIHGGAVLSGHSYSAQLLGARVLELPGLVGIAWGLWSLCVRRDLSPALAWWLALASPAALISAVASGHNDTLMLGLLLVGLAWFDRGHLRLGIVLMALAATVKLPALAGVAFATWSLASTLPWRQRLRPMLEAGALTGLVLAAATWFAGYGWGWASPAALKIPTELRILITPVVSVATLLAAILHALGLHPSTSVVITVTQDLCELLALLVVATLWWRVRPPTLLVGLGAALGAVVLLSPTVWPWYFLWGLTVLAATSYQRSRWTAIVAGASTLLVGAGGTMMITGQGYHWSGPLVIAGAVWFVSSGGWSSTLNAHDVN